MGFKDNIPDEQLVNTLKHGDVHAFSLIFENYSSKLYIFALEYLKSKEEAEELVQEVFTTIWDRCKKLKAELSFKSYIFTIAYNIIKKRFRQRTQFRQFVDSEIIDDVCTETSKTVDYNSLKNHIAELADALPTRRKQVFLKSRFEGLSNEEISKELGITKKTVENHLNLASNI